MRFYLREFLFAVFSISIACIPTSARSDTLTLHCSYLVRMDVQIGPDEQFRRLSAKFQTPYDQDITLVQTVMLDRSTRGADVLAPGSSTPVDYGMVSDQDKIVGRIVSSQPVQPGDPNPAQKVSIVNIDRTTGAFSFSETLIFNFKPIKIDQVVGTCMKGGLW